MSALDFDFEKWLEERQFTATTTDSTMRVMRHEVVDAYSIRSLYALLSEAKKQAFIAGAGYAIRSEMGSEDRQARAYAEANKYGIVEWWDDFNKRAWTPVELPKGEA